jgi:two-component system chemotaxis response regulator CheY
LPVVQAASRPSVLLVEDDLETRTAVEQLLRDAGYEVATARDGREAMLYLDDHPPPAVIVTDLFMPIINGWEFVKRLQHNPKVASTPVVVITASAAHWGHPVARSRVLQKPFTETQLLKLLAEVMATRQDH